MAICNRDLDSSQQEIVLEQSLVAVANGVTLPVCAIPTQSLLLGARVAGFGISGAPTGALTIKRFIVGAGTTSYLGGFTTLTVQSVGTSGIQSVVIAAAGSTALNLQAGDVIMYTSGGGSGAALESVSVSVIIKAVQEIRQNFGL